MFLLWLKKVLFCIRLVNTQSDSILFRYWDYFLWTTVSLHFDSNVLVFVLYVKLTSVWVVSWWKLSCCFKSERWSEFQLQHRPEIYSMNTKPDISENNIIFNYCRINYPLSASVYRFDIILLGTSSVYMFSKCFAWKMSSR